MALFDTAAEGLSPVLYALTRAQDRGSGVARKLLGDLVTVQNYLRDMVAFLGESA